MLGYPAERKLHSLPTEPRSRTGEDQKKMKIASLPAVCLLLVGAASFASAETVTFTDSFTGTGTLGSNSFTDSLVTISGSGDTANVNGIVLSPLSGVTITIESLSQTVNLTAPFQNVQLFDNNYFELTALSETSFDSVVFQVSSNALNGADFSSQVGPVVGADTFFVGGTDAMYATDGGLSIWQPRVLSRVRRPSP